MHFFLYTYIRALSRSSALRIGGTAWSALGYNYRERERQRDRETERNGKEAYQTLSFMQLYITSQPHSQHPTATANLSVKVMGHPPTHH